MAKARAHLLISGRVQGVCYRSFTQNAAYSCNVNGWVKNCGDGSVEAVFEGEKDAVEKLIALCRKGPSGSRVANIDIQWEDCTDKFGSFSIKYL